VGEFEDSLVVGLQDLMEKKLFSATNSVQGHCPTKQR
jgi:hypothetical protein